MSPLHAEPQPLTISDIARIKDDFVQTAVHALRAGFEVIEIHAAHGYLLNQFVSLVSNLRTDDYPKRWAGLMAWAPRQALCGAVRFWAPATGTGAGYWM